MAKKEKAKKDIGEKAKEGASLKPTGEQHRPLPWVEPYPESKMKDGKETVFVRASVGQDITINGVQYKMGQKTIPCDIAHSHANVLSAPKE